MGLGADGQIYVINNLSGKHRAEDWAAQAVDAYVKNECDLLWVETNRGGTAHAALLRVIARARGLELRELTKDERPMRVPGKVNMRGINTRGQKAARAGGAAALCERGRVTFLKGLDTLEDRLCGFDGSEGKKDDDVDAFVHGCHELGDLGNDVLNPKAGFKGVLEVSRQLAGAGKSTSLASMLGPRKGSTI